MPDLVQIGSGYVALLTLILVRTSGIVLVAPVFGTNEVPPQVRAFLALALAAIVSPAQTAALPLLPSTLIEFSLVLAGELLIGIVLGLGISILFSAFQLTGGIVGQLSGMSLGDVFNPGLDDNIPLFSHMLHLVCLAVYVVIGGHRLLLGGLLDSFAALPPGSAGIPVGLDRLFVDLISESFRLGVRAAAPATLALLLATVVLGLVSRSLPQLNILALGFGFNAIVTFSVMTVSFAAAAWLLEDRLQPVLETVQNALIQPPD